MRHLPAMVWFSGCSHLELCGRSSLWEIRLIEDRSALETIVARLTALHESKFLVPWKLNLIG